MDRSYIPQVATREQWLAARKALLEIDNCGKKGLAYCIWLEKKDSNTTCLLTVMC